MNNTLCFRDMDGSCWRIDKIQVTTNHGVKKQHGEAVELQAIYNTVETTLHPAGKGACSMRLSSLLCS